VGVAVVEAGQGAPAAQVDHARRRPRQCAHGGAGARGHDPALRGGERLHFRLSLVI
jgi:hypothetical protein